MDVRGRWWLLVPSIAVGACAAVAVPNLLTAMDRSAQKRTMADMRTIATAIEAYNIDHPDWKPQRRGYVAGQLAPLLEPGYVKKMPRLDGWNRPIHVALWTADGAAAYRVWSLAKDGKRDAAWGGLTNDFNRDIVYELGAFKQYPEGV
jgi:general secretion pathway protein G